MGACASCPNNKDHNSSTTPRVAPAPDDAKVVPDNNLQTESKKDTPEVTNKPPEQLTNNPSDANANNNKTEGKDIQRTETPEIDKNEEEKFFKSKGDAFRTKKMGFWETGEEFGGKVSPRFHGNPEESAPIIQRLKTLDIFNGLQDEDLQLLVESVYTIEFQAGDIVFHEGDEGSSFYIVKEGKFVDEKGEELEYFCESALLYHYKATNTVTSKTIGTLYAIKRIDYQRLQMTKAKSDDQNNIDFLSVVPILRPLTDAQRVAIASSLQKHSYKRGELIVKQGDVGDTFYIIEEGEVKVREHRGGTVVDLLTRKRGDYFGEMSLLKDEPRSADCVAATDEVTCLSLTRSEFMELLGDLHELLEHNQAVRLLQAIELFNPLSEERLYQIAKVLKPMEYHDKDVIIQQGKKGQNFYIVKEGHVQCVDESNNNEVVGELVAGEHFGEGALLTNQVRRVTVIARGEVVVLALNKQSFDTVLGGLKEHLLNIFEKRRHDSTTIDWDDIQTVKLIGAGSYGSVFLARRKSTGMSYALKKMYKSAIINSDHQIFVLNEKRILEKLHHPFITNLYHTFKDDDSVYMLMELCLGGELYTLMRDTVNEKPYNENAEVPGCFPLNETTFYTANIVLALEYIHGLGICHRDLKPENLLLNNEGYLKLADFGFAKQINNARTYSLCGTPEYTAPEVYRRSGHNVSVDWWALGVLLYEMASGFSPFHVNSENPWECYVEINHYTQAFPHIQFPSIFPHSLNNLLIQLMNPNPFKRIGSRRDGTLEIKKHPFFQDFDWEKLANQQIPAPHLPNVKGLLDVSNFTEDVQPLPAPELTKKTSEGDWEWVNEF